MWERVKTIMNREKTLTTDSIRFDIVPSAQDLKMAVSIFKRRLLITNCDVDESPVRNSRSGGDRVREPAGQLSRQMR